MFRRREDSLFDTATDNQLEDGMDDSGTPSNQASSPSVQALSGTSAFSSPGASATRTPATQENRTASPSAQPASAFRPSTTATSATSDLTRNRMPEAKPASSFTPPGAASQPASSFMPPMGEKKGGAKRVLTVGNDILLKGEIATCDRLVIEGKVDATLSDVHTVEIAEHGSFKGAAHIEDAEISGLFEGDLIVRNRLVIYATGKVRGKITYGEIEIERGGELTGEIKTTTAQAATVSTRRAPKDDKVAA